MKKVINTIARSVTFTFDGLEPITMHAEAMSAANYDYAVLHGLAARIGDAAALQKTAENNFTVTEAMRRAEVEALVKFYENKDNLDWNVKTRAVTKPVFNPQIQALAEASGKTYNEAAIWYNAKLQAELDAFAAELRDA
jgi:hypothetical protein